MTKMLSPSSARPITATDVVCGSPTVDFLFGKLASDKLGIAWLSWALPGWSITPSLATVSSWALPFMQLSRSKQLQDMLQTLLFAVPAALKSALPAMTHNNDVFFAPNKQTWLVYAWFCRKHGGNHGGEWDHEQEVPAVWACA